MSPIVFCLRLYCRFIDSVSALLGRLSAYLMPVLAFIVVLEVFCRYVLNKPTIWAHELSLFIFGYIAILGGAYAQQQRAHIHVDVLYSHVNKKTKCLFDLISFSLGIFFLVVMIIKSNEKLLEAIEFNYRTQEWGAPMHHFWIMVMVGSTVFTLQLVRGLVANIYYLLAGVPLLEKVDSENVEQGAE